MDLNADSTGIIFDPGIDLNPTDCPQGTTLMGDICMPTVDDIQPLVPYVTARVGWNATIGYFEKATGLRLTLEQARALYDAGLTDYPSQAAAPSPANPSLLLPFLILAAVILVSK